MIEVQGTARLMVHYTVRLDMSEDDFDALTAKQQDAALDAAIDWAEVCRSAEAEDFEVDDLVEVDD